MRKNKKQRKKTIFYISLTMLSLKANKSTFFLGRDNSDQEENKIKQRRPYNIKDIFIKSYYDHPFFTFFNGHKKYYHIPGVLSTL